MHEYRVPPPPLLTRLSLFAKASFVFIRLSLFLDPIRSSDVDLFLYGLGEKEATEKVKQIHDAIKLANPEVKFWRRFGVVHVVVAVVAVVIIAVVLLLLFLLIALTYRHKLVGGDKTGGKYSGVE